VHYLLIYDVSPEFIERRAQFRAEHLALAWQAVEAGDLVLAGALAEPTDQAFLLFSGQSPAAATRFAESDPYVRNGLVKHWRVVQWNTVVGHDASNPVRPR
jgi:uncharacterized protein YciI